MKNTIIATWILALGFSLGAAGCKKDSDKGSEGAKPATTEKQEAKGAAHAAKDVVPGSHEDWCDEHQVPESQCSRCDPNLVPAFKATGDWCEEHGLPKSQDVKHNPDLKIVRPPAK